MKKVTIQDGIQEVRRSGLGFARPAAAHLTLCAHRCRSGTRAIGRRRLCSQDGKGNRGDNHAYQHISL